MDWVILVTIAAALVVLPWGRLLLKIVFGAAFALLGLLLLSEPDLGD